MTVTADSRAELECSDPESRQSDPIVVARRSKLLPVQHSAEAWNPVRFAPETD